MQRHTREFGGFRRDCRALAAWLAELGVELVVMESTGIYCNSVHAHLESAGIPAWVVNAHMIKHVPGRKTDMADSEWLAVLARFGLVRASFIPPKDLRELRLVSRYRRKLSAMCASEINRLHKILDDGGIKLGGVVSDINGVSARAMVSALIEGKSIDHMLGLARGKLKQKREDLGASLEGDLSARHLFVLGHIHSHIETLQRELDEIDAYLLGAMRPYSPTPGPTSLLQTIPGIDEIAAVLILIEIGDDMGRFGCAARLASWAALSPGNNDSAGKRKSGRTRHCNSIAGPASGAVTLDLARAISRIDRAGADAIPRQLAHAARGRAASPRAGQGRRGGAGGGLRLRSRLRASLQAPGGPAASRVAACAGGVTPRCGVACERRLVGQAIGKPGCRLWVASASSADQTADVPGASNVDQAARL